MAATRRIYAHSVVPGGVRDRHELAQVIKSDVVMATHYAGFNVEAARPVTLAKARAVHVSYRKDGQIYWTRHKVMLEPGEILLSDGTNEIRARCANRISEVAQLPVALDEPAPEMLDSHTEGPSEGAAMQELAAPDMEADPAQGPFRLVTFSSGAPLGVAGSNLSGDLMLAQVGDAAGDSLYRSAIGQAGSTVRLGSGRTSSTGNADAASSPPQGGGAAAPAQPEADTAPQLLPMVTPTLPDPPLPGLDVLASEPPAPPPVPSEPPIVRPADPPLEFTLTDGADLPLTGTDRPLPPPFDPERPQWLPPPSPPAEAARPLPHGEVPEPGTVWLLAVAAAGLAWLRRPRTPSWSR